MRIANNLPQNGKEWLIWRKGGLGASDAPVIMDVSPYTSRFELWLEKTGMSERPDFHPMAIKAMARGTLLEPQARECYEKKVGARFEANINLIHPTHDFIRCSLDGHNSQLNRIVEIKCPGKIDLEEAKKGRVPKKYLPQVQLQLLLSGAVACDYFTYDGEDGSIVTVLPDPVYQQSLEDEMTSFWQLVRAKEPPLLSTKDVVKCLKQVETLEEKLTKARSVYNFAQSTLTNQRESSNVKK
jgi:putative phage-type endonuclease